MSRPRENPRQILKKIHKVMYNMTTIDKDRNLTFVTFIWQFLTWGDLK